MVEPRNAVLAFTLQETLLTAKQYEINIPGFKAYHRRAKQGFEGLSLFASTSVQSWQLTNDPEDWFIHVRMANVTNSKVWDVVAVYLKSGTSFRTTRKRQIRKLCDRLNRRFIKDPEAAIVVMGDFNEIPKIVDGWVQKYTEGRVQLAHRSGMAVSRPASGKAIDYFLVSKMAQTLARAYRVRRDVQPADHWAIQLPLRRDVVTTAKPAQPKLVWEKKILPKQIEDFANSRRFEVLAQTLEETGPSDDLLQEWNGAVHAAALDTGMKSLKFPSVHAHYSRMVVRTMRKAREARNHCRRQLKGRQCERTNILESLNRASELEKRATKVKKRYQRKQEKKRGKTLSKLA